VAIPSSVTSIGVIPFVGCSALGELTIHASIGDFGGLDAEALWGVTTLEHVTLVGYPLGRAVVWNVATALAPGAKVVSSTLAGQKFGRDINSNRGTLRGSCFPDAEATAVRYRAGVHGLVHWVFGP
jgi:hypothetical protein